jgi:hypothetical protein
MKTTIRLFALASLITVAACGIGLGSGDQPVSGPGPATGMCAPDVPNCVDVVVDEDPLGGVTYRPIEVEGDLGGEALPVSAAELIDTIGNRIEIGFFMGVDECYLVEAVNVTETEEKVAVEILVAGRPEVEVCIDMAEARSVAVELDAPLGERVLEVGGVAANR